MMRLLRGRPGRMVWLAAVGAITLASYVSASFAAGRSETAAQAVSTFAWATLAPVFAVLGTAIARKQSNNRIGWLLLLIGGGLALDSLGEFAAGIDEPASMTVGLFGLLWINNWSWVAWLFPFFLLLYLFPNGTLLSRRWRWAPRLVVVMAALMLFLAAFPSQIGPFDESWSVPNPIGFITAGTLDAVILPWFLGLLTIASGGVISMIQRYRRSSYVERAQIKWVMLAVALFGSVYAIALILEAWATPAGTSVLALATAGVPLSITLAILKYRLYEIDAVISRTFTYGALAVFIGGAYVGVVVGLGALLGRESGSFGLSVAATALVAVAFQPVRSRVERWANRLVFGERATPYEVLAQFSRRVSETSDEDLLARIPRLIVDGTGALQAALWVRAGEGFRTASSWPDESRRLISSSSRFTDPEAGYSLPVFHDGELLGGISLAKSPGETVTPAEQELLTNLAGGLGLALRNTRLTAQLRRQVEDLERSRDRLVSAADEARRSLEHDLDSGPQQQLVAVKVKLGPVRKMAEQHGAHKTARVLADIESQAGDAIKAVRDFAGGIYPPLLEAEGLAVALRQQARKAALNVSIQGENGRRYPRDIEAAVYFTVLEALQNTAKYAEASTATVKLLDTDGALLFEVRDDGVGFDPGATRPGVGLNGMADRIDTVGGSWDIESTPGGGTIVSGSVPIREFVRA